MPATQAKRQIAVFIASPGDLRKELEQFRKAIDSLNSSFGEGARVTFEAFGWDDTLTSTDQRSHGVINQEIDQCDVFILVMHRRWGQEAPDAASYTSYTEEEFSRALGRWKKTKKPEIFVFFKRVEAAQEADAGPQLKKVVAFRKYLEKYRQVRYWTIDDSENAFLDEVNKRLKAYALGELPKADRPREALPLPQSDTEDMNLLKRNLEEAQSRKEARELEIAEDAASLALAGFLEHARAKFVSLIGNTANIEILALAETFFTRTGDLATSLEILERWLALAGSDTREATNAMRKRGNIYETHGDWDRAEAMYQKALAIDEALGDKQGMANDYASLGIVYFRRGDLDQAEAMYQKALAIDEALDNKQGMATHHANLGVLHENRSDLDQAETMYQKALAIDEALGNKQGMAASFTNLGNVYRTRGDLDQAEAMYQKALAIDEALGDKRGMAAHYGNLGNVYFHRGDLDQAETMYQKALVLNEALGNKQGMVTQYANLGVVFASRKDWDLAEGILLKALAIGEALGNKKGMATQYANLGLVYRDRGDLDQAETMWRTSLVLFETLGSPEAEKVRSSLEDLRGTKVLASKGGNDPAKRED